MKIITRTDLHYTFSEKKFYFRPPFLTDDYRSHKKSRDTGRLLLLWLNQQNLFQAWSGWPQEPLYPSQEILENSEEREGLFIGHLRYKSHTKREYRYRTLFFIAVFTAELAEPEPRQPYDFAEPEPLRLYGSVLRLQLTAPAPLYDLQFNISIFILQHFSSRKQFIK